MLDRPDMLIFLLVAPPAWLVETGWAWLAELLSHRDSELFTYVLFTWQGAGADDAAEADVANYVAGGLLPLHYGSIKYLPCYAAAGARIKLGYFDQSGKVCPEAIIGPIVLSIMWNM